MDQRHPVLPRQRRVVTFGDYRDRSLLTRLRYRKVWICGLQTMCRTCWKDAVGIGDRQQSTVHNVACV